ncbi:MAG: radical SAM protein [Myxococcota bacterium]
MPSQTVRIGLACNEGCLFCFADPEMWASRPRGTEDYSNLIGEDWRAAFRKVRSDGFDGLSISGGEPALHPDLVRMVKYARLLGFNRVELQSNATLLNEANVRRLARAGLCSALISLPGHREKVYNALTATRGYYEAALQGIRNLLDAGVRVSIAHVMCTANYEDVEPFVEFVAEHFPTVSSVRLLYVQPEGRATKYPGLYPDLDELRPRLHAAMRRCDDLGLPFTTDVQCGVPMCVMGGFEERVDRDLLVHPENFWGDDLSSYRYMQGHKRKGAQCGECFFSGVCHGFWQEYLDAYGDTALKPVAPSPRLLSLFPEIAAGGVSVVPGDQPTTLSRMRSTKGIQARRASSRGCCGGDLAVQGG